MKTYGKASLSSKVASFLFLDPSLNTTGFAIYKIEYDPAGEISSGKYWREKLIDYGLIKIAQDLQTLESIHTMRFRVKSLVREFYQPIDAVIVETPEIVYAGNQDIKKLLAKAASTLETAMAAATMLTVCQELGRDTALIRPREWQAGHGRPKKVNSKIWSLTVANSIIASLGRSGRLGTKNDENVADAISMGSLLMQKIFTQQIQFR